MHLLRNSRENVKFESYAAISLSPSVHIELDPIAGYQLARAHNRTIEGRQNDTIGDRERRGTLESTYAN